MDPAGWKLIDDVCDDVPLPTTAVQLPEQGAELAAYVTSVPEFSDPL